MPRVLSLNVVVYCDPIATLGGPDKVPVLVLFLDEDGFCHLLATEEPHTFLHYPESIRAFRDLVWRRALPRGSRVTGDARKVNELATRLRPLLERVHAGHAIEPCDGVPLGRLTEDAAEACRRIQRMIDTADWTVDAPAPRPAPQIRRPG